MKTLVLLLIGLLPIACDARKFQIGIGMGASSITAPADGSYLSGTQAAVSPAAEISGTYSISKHLQAGLKVSVAKLYTTATSYYSPWWFCGTFDGQVRQQFMFGSPSFLITPFISYKMKHLYFGAQAGVFTTTNRDDVLTLTKFYYGGELGYMAGLHLGYEQKIAKRLSLYAEGNGNFMYLQWQLSRYQLYNLKFFQAQLAAGIRIQM